MTNEFIHAYNTVLLPNEGGYANDPKDRGGETYKGIARNFWPKWTGWATIDRIKQTARTARSINAMAAKDETLQASVKQFYYDNFAKAIRFDEIRHDAVGVKLLDVAVNVGVKRASQWLQKAVNDITQRRTLTVDGKIGPVTLNAVNAASGRALLALIRAQQVLHYLAIVKSSPSQSRFLVGWLNRAEL
jgi:lysozyme family protein